MAKFCGNIGFMLTKETSPGVWTPVYEERKYYGDVLSNTRRWEASEYVNDNLVINNRISILADKFAYENFSAMRYVTWNNVDWKITSVDIQRPRIILSMGEVYNGPKARTP